MDADRPNSDVCVERVTEPFSGLPLLRVGGWCAAEVTAVEVRYDGATAIRVDDLDRAAGRTEFGTQLPLEPRTSIVEVVAVRGDVCDILFQKRLADIGAEPHPPASGLTARVVNSVTSGEVLSLSRWKARLSRASEKLLALRQKVRNRLLARRYRPRSQHHAYAENTEITPRVRAAMTEEIVRFRHKPTFSILVPVYNVEPRWLRKAIESVVDQVYPHWELCLADDNSTEPELIAYLNHLPRDSRIKLVRRDTNGHICHATNSAADLATGDFVCLLDNDDTIATHALFAFAERLQQQPDADLLYSDEDKSNEADSRYDPQFKPDWSPELLLSYNYVNHFTCIRRSMFEKAGRFRPGFEGSQDHDLLLRVTELTDRVQHVPQILYHWRALESSTASAAGVKPIVHTSGRRAVEEALARRGIAASLHVPQFAQKLNLPVLALDGPDTGPSVAIIIRGTAADARKTVRAIKANTAYKNFTDYLVLDAATPAEALNRTAASRSEDLLLFLDAGTEPSDPRWLSRLVANLQLKDVGAVGGVFRDADGRVTDAGPVLGMRDGTGPANAFAGLKRDEISYYFYAEVTRNTSAVSGRCLLTRRATFDRLGGFDARRFPRSLWDIDYGLRLRGQGLRCATVGGAELRGGGPRNDCPTELLTLKRAYGRSADPHHNPNCSERDAWTPACDSPLSLSKVGTAHHALPVGGAHPTARVLVAAHNLNNPEGAPRYLSEIVIGLRDRGAITPVVFSPLGGAGAKVYADARVPVVVRETPEASRFVDGQWSPREYEAVQKLAAGVLREQQPEVVVANTLTTFPLVEAAARAGIPSVWIIHESYGREHLARLFPPFAFRRIAAAFALASRVVPASHDTAALFAHLNTRGNVRVIHNGLEPKPFDDYLRRTPRPVSATKRLLAVGTVCERKGQHTLVEAAALLARERTDFAVDLVGVRGGIPYAEYVRSLVTRYRLESVVNLVPETDDVWAFYRAADVFVVTSHMETFSRAVLEAEAFGLPVVSTPVSGVAEQIHLGWNGEFFPFGDAAALAKSLARYLDDDALCAEAGRQSRAAFDNHLDHREMLDRYAATILSAARRGSRAHVAVAPPLVARRAA